MGERLGLDVSYISQLETDKRPVDNWYVTRAIEEAEKLEKSKEVNAPGEVRDISPNYHPNRAEEIRQQCRDHLEQVLESCGSNELQLSWTLIELQRRLFIREPAAPPAPGAQKISSSLPPDFAERVERAISSGKKKGSDHPHRGTS